MIIDDFFNFLERNGINTDVIKVVDNETDLDYVIAERENQHDKIQSDL